MAKVALFQLRTTVAGGGEQVGEQAAFLLDDPNIVTILGSAMAQRLAAQPPGEPLAYTIEVYDLANPPPEGG
jgi:hypothetical protein